MIVNGLTRRHPSYGLSFALVAVLLAACGAIGPDPAASSQAATAESAVPTPSITTQPTPSEQSTEESDAVTTIRITVANQTISAQLADNPTAQDLASQLPLTLKFSDFNGVEKIAELPRPLTMDGVPPGDDPDVNDIGYYAPSNNLVFCYGDVGYWNGIVRIGQFSGQDIALIGQQPDDTEITIERG